MKFTSLRLAGLVALMFGSIAAAAPEAVYTAKEVAQGYRDTVVLAKPRASIRAQADAAELAEGLVIHQKFSRIGDLRVLGLKPGDTVPAALARLRATGRYEYVEPDRLLHASVTPNDPSFAGQQWSLNNTGNNGPGSGTANADIRALTAWDTLHDASSVVVAVLDSGARLTHEDLAANLWTSSGTHGASFTESTGHQTNTTPNDTDVGHGTHVSGIIGAVGNNGVGISGVAWKVQLMELRFLHGTGGQGSTSDAIAGIDFAIAHGAKVINASFGSSDFEQAESDAIKAAGAADIIYVAAAGNDGVNVDNGSAYPAGYALDNIVTVAATTNTDALDTSYSNFGSGSVDLAAPGTNIFSTFNGSDSDYQTESGTSMAAPHVTGAIALLRAKFPSESYRQIINRLLRSVTPLKALVGKAQSGGRLNLAAALTSTSNLPFNDNFANRADLGSNPNIHVRSNNVGATEESGEPAHAGSAGTASLWWSWTAPSSSSVTFSTVGSSYDTKLAIYTGTTLSGLTPVASNDDDTAHGKTTSAVTINVTANVTYQIAVDCKSGSTPGLTLLSVGTVPANDNWTSATPESGSGFNVTGTTFNASTDNGEQEAIGYAAGHTVWYKWTAPASGHYSIYAYSPTVDMFAAVYTGNSVGSLSLVSDDDDSTAYISSGTYTGAVNSNSLVPFNATAGTTYYFQVDTTNESPTGGDFTLTLSAPAWQFAAFGGIVSSPAVGSSGTIYFGAGTSITDEDLGNGSFPENNVYALNPDGTQKWKYTTGAPLETASPALGSDGTVYIGSGDSKLYALNGATGSLKWSYTASAEIVSTPAIATNGTIYFRDDNYLYALTDQTTSAALKWKTPLGTGTYNSPVIAADGTVYVGSTGGKFYAVNPDGTSKWTVTVTGDIYSSAAIATDGTIYVGTISTDSLSGAFYALNPADGSTKWKWSGTAAITSSPVLAPDGTIYFGAYDNKLHALNSSNGSEKWSYTMGDQVRAASPAVGNDGNVYMAAYDGQVYVVNSNGSLVRTYYTAALVRSSPMIANGQLYFGSTDGVFYAFNLNAATDQSPANSAWPVFQHNTRHDGQFSSNVIAISVSPVSQSAAIGSSLTLGVTATGPGTLSYQWLKNGAAISGATNSTYTINNAQTSDSGSYSVQISSSTGLTTTSAAATVTVSAVVTAPGHLINISVRTNAGTGDSTLLVGFVVGGSGTSGTKPLLIRGVGPTLMDFGVSGALADPNIDIIPSGSTTSIASNDNWGSNATQIITVGNAVGAFSLDSTTSKDSALYLTPSAGVYSVKVTGVGNTTGIVLAEIYDATGSAYTTSTPRLINVSARAQVGTGDGVLIAGFVVAGSTPRTVLIRGVGPTLATYGVTGTLADPQLDVTQTINGANVEVQSNDNWGGDTAIVNAATAVGAFALPDGSSKDAAILVTLAPGVYSAKVSGAGNTTGVALIEVYEVP